MSNSEFVSAVGTISVLLIESDGGRVRQVLSSDPGVETHAVDSLSSAARVIRNVRPRAVVAAFRKPSADDANAFKRLRREAGTTPVLVISDPVGERQVTELIKAGASGYLFSNEAPHVAAAVRELVRGGVPMSSPVSRIVLGRARRSSAQMAAVLPATPAADSLLTARQREILKLLSNGHSYEDIGVALNLSVNTVRSHVRALYERLGASTKVEAVLIGIELRLLDERPGRPKRD
ncbi:MAG TPA: response regulator transcription factor [Polyangiaceae bacterium]|jgi:DNA-binding NarL/FixJ family response regulator|nr:response regulator transcription factor [Polyangiaceae bacterium]